MPHPPCLAERVRPALFKGPARRLTMFQCLRVTAAGPAVIAQNGDDDKDDRNQQRIQYCPSGKRKHRQCCNKRYPADRYSKPVAFEQPNAGRTASNVCQDKSSIGKLDQCGDGEQTTAVEEQYCSKTKQQETNSPSGRLVPAGQASHPLRSIALTGQGKGHP